MFYVYLLQSKKNKRFYIGVTKDIEKRIRQHNKGFSRSTKPYLPWILIHIEKFHKKTDAYKREYYLKHPKGYREKLRVIKENSF